MKIRSSNTKRIKRTITCIQPPNFKKPMAFLNNIFNRIIKIYTPNNTKRLRFNFEIHEFQPLENNVVEVV